jgi:iron complex outermembrane receptor protein
LSIEQSLLRQRVATSSYTAYAGQRYATVLDGFDQRWNRNTGMLAQASTSWRDALFVTGGVRVERNDAFSGNDRYPVLPLLGAAFVRTIGPVEMKLRSSYGKGIRPALTTVRSSFGERSSPVSAHAGLDPEVQTGIESGVELYFGDLFSMQATRFDQQATGLIQNVAVSVDTQLRAGAAERRIRFQPENVGEISNRGWELQAALHRGALALTSTFTSVDSRVRTVSDGYLGDLRAGDRMLAVPAHTASFGVSWITDGWTTALSATRAMDWINYDRVALARAYVSSDAAQQRDVTGWRMRNFWRPYDGQTHLRLAASRDLGRGLELLVAGENLLGGQLGEPDNLTIRQGRTVTGGLRAAF